MTTIADDERLAWPDSLAISPGGELYVTASQIHLSPRFNHGKSLRTTPYRLFKLKLEDSPGGAGGVSAGGR